MWFNYGNVNGFDFWNNSDAIKPEGRAKMGSISRRRSCRQRADRIEESLSSNRSGSTGENKEILKDTTKYVFMQRKGARVIDQITTLQALDKVVFNDDKEGLLGMRVAHWLESPEEKGGIFMDASGRADEGGGGRDYRRDRRLPHQRGRKGRSSWAHSRPLVHPHRS